MVSSIEISFKSYEYKLIKNASLQILKFVPKCWFITSVCLPSKIKKITVLRSPHIDKKSREQFQMKFLKNMIILLPYYTNKNMSSFIESNNSTSLNNQVNLMNEIYLFLENMKQCPLGGVQVQIQIIYKCYI